MSVVKSSTRCTTNESCDVRSPQLMMLLVAGSSTIAYSLLTNGGNFFFLGGAAIGMPAIPRGAAIFIEEGLVRLGGCIILEAVLYRIYCSVAKIREGRRHKR